MNLDNLTIGEAKQLANMFGGSTNHSAGLNAMIGKKVIIRTYSAGVWFGDLSEKSNNEVILTGARRMWQWRAKKSISLSAVATHGIQQDKSKICEPVEQVWLEAIEIIPCTSVSISSIDGAPHVEAQ